MKPRLLLIGGGGHCASCVDVIEAEGRFAIAGIVDNAAASSCPSDCRLLGTDADIGNLRTQCDYALIAVGHMGDPGVRDRLFHLAKSLGYHFPTIVSPRAYVSGRATVGEGTIVMHDALVNVRATIGANCIINTKALVEHDAVVEDGCHISTAAVINGGARIRRGSFVGSNSVTREGTITVEGAFIKAGSLNKGTQ